MTKRLFFAVVAAMAFLGGWAISATAEYSGPKLRYAQEMVHRVVGTRYYLYLEGQFVCNWTSSEAELSFENMPSGDYQLYADRFESEDEWNARFHGNLQFVIPSDEEFVLIYTLNEYRWLEFVITGLPSSFVVQEGRDYEIDLSSATGMTASGYGAYSEGALYVHVFGNVVEGYDSAVIMDADGVQFLTRLPPMDLVDAVITGTVPMVDFIESGPGPIKVDVREQYAHESWLAEGVEDKVLVYDQHIGPYEFRATVEGQRFRVRTYGERGPGHLSDSVVKIWGPEGTYWAFDDRHDFPAEGWNNYEDVLFEAPLAGVYQVFVRGFHSNVGQFNLQVIPLESTGGGGGGQSVPALRLAAVDHPTGVLHSGSNMTLGFFSLTAERETNVTQISLEAVGLPSTSAITNVELISSAGVVIAGPHDLNSDYVATLTDTFVIQEGVTTLKVRGNVSSVGWSIGDIIQFTLGDVSAVDMLTGATTSIEPVELQLEALTIN